jgi:hypothetical protein
MKNTDPTRHSPALVLAHAKTGKRALWTLLWKREGGCDVPYKGKTDQQGLFHVHGPYTIQRLLSPPAMSPPRRR